MHNKKLFSLLVILSLCYVLYSLPFSEVKDIEKIRWINCGDGNFDLPRTDYFTFEFKIRPSIDYYKVYDVKSNSYYTPGEGEEYSILEGEFSILYEYKENYFVYNLSSQYYDYLQKQKDSYFVTKQGYHLSEFDFDDPEIYVREDKNKFSVDNICGKYLKVKDNRLYTIVSAFSDLNYIGTIYVSDNNQTIRERGTHFISYNENEDAFYSDSLYCKEKDAFEDTGNDNFCIRVIKFNDKEKLLLLDTPQYTRPYVPMEDFFTPNTSGIIRETYGNEKENLLFYAKPDFDSEIIKSLDRKETIYGKIIESKDTFEEVNNKISKWVKFRLKDGFEGWVWGRNITLFDWPDDYDPEKVMRYAHLNKRK